MPSSFIAEATMQKQKINKDICYDITPCSGSSVDCRYHEKQSQNFLIDSHLA